MIASLLVRMSAPAQAPVDLARIRAPRNTSRIKRSLAIPGGGRSFQRRKTALLVPQRIRTNDNASCSVEALTA